MDAVVWVEGPTEADCFPILLTASNRPLKAGEIVASLRNTGDLEGKQAEIVADIYRNLSSAGALFPRHMIISLDGDKKQHPKAKALEIAFGKILRFLPRYCYENYLLHSRAIAAVLNTLPAFIEGKINDDAVSAWLDAKGNSPAYGAEKAEVGSPGWMASVNAPVLLSAMFRELSETRQTYDKRVHGAALTRWLLENEPHELEELRSYVVGLLPLQT